MAVEDYYKVLGVNRDANKKEIKEAFRKLAMQYHPDKQSNSKSTSSSPDTKFRLVSEAYQALIDDRNRADYNLRLRHSNSNPNPTYTNSYGYGYSNSSSRSGSSNRFENVFRYLKTRAFLLNLSFACALLSGVAVVNLGRDLLWKKHNSGKSFEDAVHASSIHKMKKSEKHDRK